ncbi:MAG: hypothetical protein LBQ98_05800 [Nitrososphaerota archaeon]|nr:hypothetical protein [Nitrososphaerota archaeon]
MLAQNIVIEGDGGVVLSVVPCFDSQGYVSMNADGTFYPEDKFEIRYSLELSVAAGFESAAIVYDSGVFCMVDSFSSSIEGGWRFEVLSLVPSGVYLFRVEFWGTASMAQNKTYPLMLAVAELTVQVVKYEPHFTPTLAYMVPSGGGLSYEQPFTIILRYEGNGPTGNLNQRAVIDKFTWTGYAQKIPDLDTMQQTLTPDLRVTNFFNQTSNVQFLAQGVGEDRAQQPVLWVDEQAYLAGVLPKTFLWETNSNHSYTWAPNIAAPTRNGDIEEWFELQASIVFPPKINPSLQANQSINQMTLQDQLVEEINSPSATLTVTPFGNTVMAIYAHNRAIDLFAKATGISRSQSLMCLQPVQYFTAQTRYAKIQYQLDQTVAAQITTEGFTNALYYNLSLGCERFGSSSYFETNFTTPYEFYDKVFNATAFKWNPLLQTWVTDNTVSITATFESAFNFTESERLGASFEEQTSDKETLTLATADLYDAGPQTFRGTGNIEAVLKRTSPLYYNLKIEAKQIVWQQTIPLNFGDNQPYTLALNFDTAAPLQVDIITDDPQSTHLQLKAPFELGGLANITIYAVTGTTNKKSLEIQPIDKPSLRMLKTLALVLPQTQPQSLLDYQETYQTIQQYYPGYSAISNDTWGFCGQTQLVVPKDQTVVALTEQNQALLYVEATNIWGTTFHQSLAVQPYVTPRWAIPFNQATLYLLALVIVVILANFVLYALRNQ